MDATDGSVVGLASVHGIPIALALAPHVLAVLTTLAGPHDRISWFAPNGTMLGSLLVSAGAAPELATTDRLIVYRVGRLLRGISTRSGRNSVLAKTGSSPVGLSLAHGRLIGRSYQSYHFKLPMVFTTTPVGCHAGEPMSTEAKCPFKHQAGAGTSNRDWWPNQLRLDTLHQRSPLANPMQRRSRDGWRSRRPGAASASVWSLPMGVST